MIKLLRTSKWYDYPVDVRSTLRKIVLSVSKSLDKEEDAETNFFALSIAFASTVTRRNLRGFGMYMRKGRVN